MTPAPSPSTFVAPPAHKRATASATRTAVTESIFCRRKTALSKRIVPAESKPAPRAVEAYGGVGHRAEHRGVEGARGRGEPEQSLRLPPLVRAEVCGHPRAHAARVARAFDR